MTLADPVASIPHSADTHPLPKKIARLLVDGPALVLVTGRGSDTAPAFLDELAASLVPAGRVIKLNTAAPPQATLFDDIAAQLGLQPTAASAPDLAKHLGNANTFILYAIGEHPSALAFEQLRQLSNIQPEAGHLGIVLAGKRKLERQLPTALRQRVSVIYRLDGESGTGLRRAAWLAGAGLLVGGTWFAAAPLPDLAVPAAPSPKPALETSLKAGPLLAPAAPAAAEDPRSHIFRTEAEAEAALQAQTATPPPAPQ